MTVRYLNTRRDLIALTVYTYGRSKWSLAGLAAFTVVTLNSNISTADGSNSLAHNIIKVSLLQLMLLVEFSLLVLLVAVISTIIIGKKHLTTHTITASPDSLTEKTNDDTTISNWRGIHKVTRGRNHIFVYLTPGLAYIIPRRAISSSDEWESLYEKMRQFWNAANTSQ